MVECNFKRKHETKDVMVCCMAQFNKIGDDLTFKSDCACAEETCIFQIILKEIKDLKSSHDITHYGLAGLDPFKTSSGDDWLQNIVKKAKDVPDLGELVRKRNAKCKNHDVEWQKIILPDGEKGFMPYCNGCEIFTDHGEKKESE